MRYLICSAVLLACACTPIPRYKLDPNIYDAYYAALDSVELYKEGEIAPEGKSLGYIQELSCRHNPNEPPATEEEAEKRLKYEAYRLGANAVAGVIYESGKYGYHHSCWHWIRVAGVAMKIDQE